MIERAPDRESCENQMGVSGHDRAGPQGSEGDTAHPKPAEALRVVAVCRERLVESLAPACRLLPVELDAGRGELREAAPNLVILDESALRDAGDAALVEFVARAREAGARACAWTAGDPDGPWPSASLRTYIDGVFVADP